MHGAALGYPWALDCGVVALRVFTDYIGVLVMEGGGGGGGGGGG